MPFKLGTRSLQNLDGVHPDLARVVKRAIEITPVDFAVIEGKRSEERQRELLKDGFSSTMNSRHLTGHAVDLGAYQNGRIVWTWPPYNKIAEAVKQAAEELDVKISWGGDWTIFRDGPHFELSWVHYPVDEFPEAA